MKKICFLVFYILLSLNSNAQFSKTHYIPPLSGSSDIVPENQYLYISTPTTTPVNFKIKEIGGNIIPGTVSKSTPYVHYVGNGIDTQLHIDASLTNTVFNNKGYIIEAEDLVYVSARVTAAGGNHAGELLSKGLASLGTRFRIGAFINTLLPLNITSEITSFVSVMATENNTTVSFSDIKNGVSIINSSIGNSSFNVTLNSGESYVIAIYGMAQANKDGLIGSLVTSDKPVVVNCGSFAGSNGEMQNLDLGFDQIVSAERTGTDYIFIKSTGKNNVERVLLVADQDNTDIFLNGSTTPSYNLNAGQYIALIGSDFSVNGNLYVNTNNPSKNIFAYQSVGDDSQDNQANQELFFVPPLSCQTPRIIDNIPSIERIGSRKFTGRVTIVTLTGATLNFTIDGANYTIASLPWNITVDGPTDVIGNPNYQTYTITGLTGNVAVKSSGELYLAAYGSSGAATFGGFYSGFTFKPEISFNKTDITQSNCIPNVKLDVNSLNPFDVYQWYYNDTLIPGAIYSSHTPTVPGYYYVSATISSCGSPVISDKIPVSSCPTDGDHDGVNNNIDLDLDGDGIANCDESFGNQNFNFTNTTSGTITAGNYSNSYAGSLTFTGSPSATPISGKSDGNLTTEARQGKNNAVTYTLANFTRPISLEVQYASSAANTDLLTSATEVRITGPSDKTLTILNPDNQILIDTNYDGIFESGITEFSSFEIRFRLNGNIPLTAGTGTFSIRGDLLDSLAITNINLTGDTTSKVCLRVIATCVPKDSDNDGIPDPYDLDSDNDSILDNIESQGKNHIAPSNKDLNKDGIDDAYGTGINPIDTDTDGIADILDLDSDNDGIHDLDESGSNAMDADNNGEIDATTFGTNGFADNLETSPDSGKPNYKLADTDNDGSYNAIELDSDNDSCNDVIEAGYTDSNSDGLLGGTTPPTVDSKGLVTSGTGYGNPNSNYIIAAPIAIAAQPEDTTVCEMKTASFSVSSNASSFEWEISTDKGTTWNTINAYTSYSGVNTANLSILNITSSMNGYKYRVFLNKTGNSCGLLSSDATLSTLPQPVIASSISIIQCDDNTDGISIFNLTQKNDAISGNYQNETITYYTSQTGAETQNPSALIANPAAYQSGNAVVFARVENSNHCFNITKIDLIVSVSQIPANFIISNLPQCDDYLDTLHDDRDGIANFNFTPVTNHLLTILPAGVSVNYYKSEINLLTETDAVGNSLAISETTNFRNTDSPNRQTIWVRVDSNVDNSCFGYTKFDLVVNPTPKIDLQEDTVICLPSSQIIINGGITDGSSPSKYQYQWYQDQVKMPGKISQTLTVTTPDVYSVEVTNSYGCSKTRTVNVKGSEKAYNPKITVEDLTDVNTVLVHVSGQGDYNYALDDINGPYQDSNLFRNVPMGFHDIYVQDKNGCGTIGPIPVSVLGTPKYFTPNGDGFNDYWNVKGITEQYNAKTIVYIMDRFGKLLKQFDGLSQGWDGFYNGREMPADDYWYTVQFEDGRNAKGHFALKR